MAHVSRSAGTGGSIHIMGALAIFAGVALHAGSGLSLVGFMGEDEPRMVRTFGADASECAARTLDTGVFGTIGCGGTKRAAHLEKTTLVRPSGH